MKKKGHDGGGGPITPWEKSHLLIWPVRPCRGNGNDWTIEWADLIWSFLNVRFLNTLLF
jgi:hypothetical protein